jgi:ABC-type transport system involved in cytochrome c biogenesis permease subunit
MPDDMPQSEVPSQDSIESLDDLVYRIVSLGFALLTMVLITGAVWAQHVYQSWWSWDPKETSALVAWLIYAAFLHGRLQRNWRGRRCAYLAILGFVAVLFCFAGINLLPQSYHAYGRPNTDGKGLGGWAGLEGPESALTKAFFVLYLVSALAHLVFALLRSRRAGTLAIVATWAGFVLQTAALAVRTASAGRLTFATGYEFALWFIWAIILSYLLLERLRGQRLVGVVVLPIALLVSMYAYLWFPDKGLRPLMPALQNKFWLHVHVAIAIFAYGCLAVAAGTAAMYLLAERRSRRP